MVEVYEDWYITHLGIVQPPQIEVHQSKKGRTFTIRHLKASDTHHLIDFMSRLSQATLWLRFFVPYPRLSDEVIRQEITRLNRILNSNGAVLVALSEVEGKEEIIGIGEVIRDEELFSTAELALTIRDDFQGEGIGSVMVHRLAEEAARIGITTLQAEAMVQNLVILLLWTKLGLPYSFNTDQGITKMLAWLDSN